MSSCISYIDRKSGKQKYFFENSPLYLRHVLKHLYEKQYGKKLTSNLYLTLRSLWIDKGMEINFKSSDTIATEVGCLAARTIRKEMNIFKKLGLISKAKTLSGTYGIKLNTKKINDTAKKLKMYFTYTDSSGKIRAIPETIYSYEKTELKIRLLTNSNILKYTPGHLDVYTFLTGSKKTTFEAPCRQIARKMGTLSSCQVFNILKDFEKCGIIQFHPGRKKFDFFPFEAPITPDTSEESCQNSAKKCQNSATSTVKILPHKSINILIYQEEHIEKLKKVSVQNNPVKNISQCWQYLKKNGVKEAQLRRHIHPITTSQKNPDEYINFKINQFEYMKKKHPFKIWGNNKARFLYNTLTNPSWNYDEYLFHLQSIIPEQPEKIPDKEEQKSDQRCSEHDPAAWIEQLKTNGAENMKETAINQSFARNLKTFLALE